MPHRVIAAFIAFVLLWSGLGSLERPHLLAQPATQDQRTVSAADNPAVAQQGSVEHHHLDDLPSQAQSDPSVDMPGLLPATPHRLTPRPAGAPRLSVVSRGAASPCLASPLRPPCLVALPG